MTHAASLTRPQLPEPCLRRTRPGRGPARVLFVSRVTLPPGERGNACYSLDCVQALAHGGMAVRTLVTEGAVRTPPLWDMPPTPEEIRLASAAIEEFKPDALLVNYSYLSPLLALAPEGCQRGILAHDARHLRHADFLTQGLRFESSPWSAEEERAALAGADFVVAIQDEEAGEFQRLAPHAAVLTAPCSFPCRALPAPQKSDACLFVGSDADHNLHGLGWLLAEVWPLVLAARPTASLRVCGTIARRLDKNHPGLEILGRVEDLAPHYAHAAAGVVPIVAGSGLKLKLVECLSMGRPVVTTPRGMAGLDPFRGALVAEDAAGFAGALLTLFAAPELACELGRQAQRLARQRFSAEACYGPLIERLAGAGAWDAAPVEERWPAPANLPSGSAL